MRKLIALISTCLALAALTAVPAFAEDTTVTFTVAAGQLTLDNVDADATDDGTVALGTVSSSTDGTTVSGSLGTTTVNDDRASLAGWTVNVSATDFTNVDASRTIVVSKAKLYNAAPTVTSGTAVVTFTHLDPSSAKTLSTTASSYMTATTTGSNQVTYSPTVEITIDADVVADSYSGVITQTVS